MLTRAHVLITIGLMSVQVIVALCLVSVAAMASARPRFLAIPLEDVEFVNVPHRQRRDGKPIRTAQSPPSHRPSSTGRVCAIQSNRWRLFDGLICLISPVSPSGDASGG